MGFGTRRPVSGGGGSARVDAGHRYLQTVATSCVIDSVGKYGFMKSNVFTKTGITFKEVVQQEPVIAETLKRNSLGKKPPRTPIFMMTGRSDDIIPRISRTPADKYCRAGATVSATQSARAAVTPTINSGINHALSRLGGYSALHWSICWPGSGASQLGMIAATIKARARHCRASTSEVLCRIEVIARGRGALLRGWRLVRQQDCWARGLVCHRRTP